MLVLHSLAVVQAQVSVEARESYFQLLFPFCFFCFLFVCLFVYFCCCRFSCCCLEVEGVIGSLRSAAMATNF